VVTPVLWFTELVSTTKRIHKHTTIHLPSHTSIKLRLRTKELAQTLVCSLMHMYIPLLVVHLLAIIQFNNYPLSPIIHHH